MRTMAPTVERHVLMPFSQAFQRPSFPQLGPKQSKVSTNNTPNAKIWSTFTNSFFFGVPPHMTVTKRRLACPQTVQHLWDSISCIRQQKQIPNLDRISNYMKRKHNLTASDLERQLNFAVRDLLIVAKKSVGVKGTKIGIEQEGYRLPEGKPEKDDHDWYCFECHRGGEVLCCTSCHRVYHSFCVKEDLSGAETFVCSVCKMTKGKNLFKMKKDDLNTLLGYTCLRLKEKTRELHRMPHTEEEVWRHDYLIYQKMDLINMEEKTKANIYKRLEEFQADAQNIVHNVVIFYGVHSVMADMARQMLRDCIYDLGEIRQCRDCYRMSNEKGDKFWFCQPCDPPHELVFAKQKGFPFWPAKVIRKHNGLYDVRFFGGHHQRANVEKDYIRPITTSLHQMSLKRTASLNRALEELKRHQQLLEQWKRESTGQAPSVTTVSKQGRPRAMSSSIKPKAKRMRLKQDGTEDNTGGNEKGDDDEEEEDEEQEKIIPMESDEGEASPDESPSSSSHKMPRLQDVPTPEDHNVVSSSSQETPTVKVSVSTQTHKKLLASLVQSLAPPTPKPPEAESTTSCNCDAKYNKMFKEVKERLEAEHAEDKEKAVKEVTDKLRKEFEDEKQKAITLALEKMQREMDQARRKFEEQIQVDHRHELQEIVERHRQEISETKKKQWCYNCEAEAIYHCCWNTSYCSVECQQIHWHKEHKRTCRRKR